MSNPTARYRAQVFEPQSFAMQTEWIVAECDEAAESIVAGRYAHFQWELFEDRRLVAKSGSTSPSR